MWPWHIKSLTCNMYFNYYDGIIKSVLSANETWDTLKKILLDIWEWYLTEVIYLFVLYFLQHAVGPM